MYKRCPECGRTFDLLDEQDAEEWYYGHDCEPERDGDVSPGRVRPTGTDHVTGVAEPGEAG